MSKIRPHLWFDREAQEAAELYVSIFPDSKIAGVSQIRDTPSGDVDVVTFELAGSGFQAISAGPLFTFTPAISFMVSCSSAEEVDRYFGKLSEGGSVLMPLDSYPFSQRYGWLQDRFGLSWQIILEEQPSQQKISPMLLFVKDVAGRAEDAVKLYTSALPGSSVLGIERWGSGDPGETEGTVKQAIFELAGQRFRAMDSSLGHDFAFNEAVSLIINCEDQAEIDRYWEALSAVPEAEQCGWLKDPFGVSWQVVPAEMDRMLSEGSREEVDRVTRAFLQMRKLDIAELERARSG